jgi:DNA repair photolyase
MDFMLTLLYYLDCQIFSQLIHAIKSNKTKNITIANKLFDLGIKVWVFITPILPGITDVEEMIDALNPQIPVFLDKVRLDKDSKSSFEMLRFIENKYPNLYNIYADIIETGNDVYCDRIKDKYHNSDRVKFVFE